MAIRQLPLQLANQIAAGEVVERPSSVVKELVENSIDAGARELFIDIEQGGAKRIRIRDNGVGIPQDELALALSRHATSKIHSLDDLESIESLGFRGEALASISSVSRLTLTSKPAQQQEAWQAFCEGRDMQVQIQPAAHPDGTTIDVQDLFFNTPARRKFLRTEKTEFGHIDEVLRRIALAAPQLRIVLRHNGKKVRDYRPLKHEQSTPEQTLPRLKSIVGQSFPQQAIHVEHSFTPWSLHGWIAPAPHCRHQGDIQYMYVNGRMMKDKLLNHAIRQAYGDTLADDRQPSYILYLQVPARDVDVNVHPAKHEVRFHQARQVHDFVLQSLRQALQAYQPELPEGVAQEINGETGQASTSAYQPPPRHAYQRSPAVPAKNDELRAASENYQALMQPANSYGARSSHEYQESQAKHSSERASDAAASTEQWQPLKLLAGRYLLVCRESSALNAELATLDVQQLQLHIEQQRIGQRVRQGLSGQPLLLPIQIALTTPVSQQQQQQLARLGIQVKVLQPKRIVVVQVPAMLRHRPIEQSMMHLLAMLDDQPLEQHHGLHSWLAEQGLTDAYSEQQARYWLSQVSDDALVDTFVCPLDWQQHQASAERHRDSDDERSKDAQYDD